ncbi:Tol-Pal system protein TolB, partial [Klebsiella aerogenes]|nr:Tol-Pal system protein TolB [Klebsiella aerogenes]
ALGIDSVVVGRVQPSADGQYVVSYQLVDVAGSPGAVLAQSEYKISNKWLRYAAHTASDEIFEKLTGIRGAFRTRIAYVVVTNG